MAGSVKTKKQKGITEDQVLEVIRLIEEEGKSENAACIAVGVNRITFRSAAFKQDAVNKYAHAYQVLATDQVEKLELAIADMRNGVIDAAMARVEIDARKWFASKFLPRQYGDKVDVTSDGKALPQPLLGGITVVPNASDDIPQFPDKTK